MSVQDVAISAASSTTDMADTSKLTSHGMAIADRALIMQASAIIVNPRRDLARIGSSRIWPNRCYGSRGVSRLIDELGVTRGARDSCVLGDRSVQDYSTRSDLWNDDVAQVDFDDFGDRHDADEAGSQDVLRPGFCLLLVAVTVERGDVGFNTLPAFQVLSSKTIDILCTVVATQLHPRALDGLDDGGASWDVNCGQLKMADEGRGRRCHRRHDDLLRFRSSGDAHALWVRTVEGSSAVPRSGPDVHKLILKSRQCCNV